MRIWAAPGRVNIIGEHTDYNAGFVLPIALPHVVRCAAEPRRDTLVTVRSRQRRGPAVRVPRTELVAQRDRVPEWARYPLGVIAEFARRGHAVTGVDLEVDGAVPIGAGLSSSAALSCAVALAARDLFAHEVGIRELIDIASTAENTYVGAPTGVLDQSAAFLCTAGHALFLDVRAFADGGSPEQIPFDLARFDLELLVIDTGHPHRLVDGEYAARRAECAAAADALGLPTLRDAEPAAVGRLTDPLLRRRARHVVSENARVLMVAEKLHDGADPRDIGPELTASHISLRDDFEVSTAALDTAVTLALESGAHGARMVGGGFGGSAIALVDRAAGTAAAIREALALKGFAAPRTFVAVPSRGAHRVE
ncbi:galactokinase [Nocardia panacis]|uniref:Galactokinase n=1 Tax=Nocardia panacis TaxID=2340916 RepID=A0A3A4KFX3_9NOCA|nr:galactokinase [Nocardia panacis]RJO79809.1 galactokinase [Nocardia panacis]